jgi:hypothetical protein
LKQAEKRFDACCDWRREIPQNSELGLKPILARDTGQGCRIVDARIRVEKSAPAV